MFSIILDHQFKHLCVIKNYVGRMNTIHFIVKYDLKVVIAIFMNFLNQQNLIVEECEIDELNE
jgi:hypothetical protein